MRKSALLALAPVAAAVVIAGCGGTSGYGGASGNTSGATSGAAPAKSAGSAPTVALARSKFGQILVDNRGRTLYDFAADTSTSSTCYGACASLWPPLTVAGTPKPGAQVSPSLLGVTKRTDGTSEVTYNGHPLYYYAGDSRPGQTTGQNINQFGALWFVLTRTGKEITHG